MTRKSAGNEHHYGIGAVAKLTGLTDHTIRVWERRYSAVVAQRAPNGRRVYGPEDVEKLGLLKRLIDQGLSIGQIAAESIETLRERAQAINEIASTPLPDRIGVAVLGDFLPGHLAIHDRDIAPLDVAVADDNRDTFVADLARHQIDVVVLESPVLDASLIEQLREYMHCAGAARGVVVYSFGRTRDVDLARDSRITALRSPVNVEEVRAAVIRAYAPSATSLPETTLATDTGESDWHFSGPVAPRRFNTQQLTRLARASTAIDCECPHHLAQLVGDLTAFEVYSAQCANRDEDDAALHHYLHQTTAQARALIETALERVAQAEGIEY
ncbi:MAG: MerR family transcriptional regulator [Gammaproteobacteria bacterium]|nr:MerR family transcriptional regulator [Gammaproteobacteria bacterium]